MFKQLLPVISLCFCIGTGSGNLLSVNGTGVKIITDC